MPAPIKPFPTALANEGATQQKNAETKKSASPKASAVPIAGKKPTAASVSASSKPNPPREKANQRSEPPKQAQAGQKETLQSPNLIQQVKPAQNGADKPTSLLGNGSLETPGLLKEMNGVPRRASAQGLNTRKNPEKRLSSPALPLNPTVATKRHVPRPRPLSVHERRSKTPDKILPASQTNALLNNASSEMHKGKKLSDTSMTSLKSTASEQERKSTFKGTVPIVKGGFMAPTKASISLRGEIVNLTSRSPSPKLPDYHNKERSVSPRRRLRESSTDSDNQSRKSVSFGIKERKPVQKDPSLPTIRRSSSLRGTGDLTKISRNMKKASMENLSKQNCVDEAAKTKRTSSLRNGINGSVRSREASKEKIDEKAAVKSIEDSKEKPAVKNNNGSTLRSRNASKENKSDIKNREGSTKRKSPSDDVSNGVKVAVAKTYLPPKSSQKKTEAEKEVIQTTKQSSTDLIMHNEEGVSTSAAVSKTSSVKLETQMRAAAKKVTRSETMTTLEKTAVTGETTSSVKAEAATISGKILINWLRAVGLLERDQLHVAD